MKYLCSLFLIVLASFFCNAQSFKIGAMGGITTDEASDVSDFVLGIDAYYMFNKKRALLNIGPTVGFRNYFSSEDGADDAQFLPLGAAARVRLLGISAGADAGYAIGLTDGLDGGFYLRPLVAFSLFSIFELNFSYEVVFDQINWGNANIGFLIQI